MKLAVLLAVLLGSGVAHAQGPVDPYEDSSVDPFGPREQRGRQRQVGKGQPFRQALVQQFDRNGDGRLEPRERKQAARALHRLANRLQHGRQGPQRHGDRRQRLIQRFDVDGDGNLGPGELPPRVIRRLRHLDRNGDGWIQNDEL